MAISVVGMPTTFVFTGTTLSDASTTVTLIDTTLTGTSPPYHLLVHDSMSGKKIAGIVVSAVVVCGLAAFLTYWVLIIRPRRAWQKGRARGRRITLHE